MDILVRASLIAWMSFMIGGLVVATAVLVALAWRWRDLTLLTSAGLTATLAITGLAILLDAIRS